MNKTNEPEEILDLVDKDDRVIGGVRKGEANQDPSLIHREVAVIIYDDQRRVLLQRRSLKKKVRPGVWTTSCAGHVPKGVKPVNAAHKEMMEELGFDTVLIFLEKVKVNYLWETHFGYWYLGKYSGEKMRLEEGEVEEVSFVDKVEFDEVVSKGLVTETSARMIRRFFEGEFE